MGRTARTAIACVAAIVFCATAPAAVGWGRIQYPADTSSTPGAETENIYGRVWKDGVTPGAGQGAGIRAQLGHGPDGSDPDGNVDWSWVEATYNGDLENDDEYRATMTESVAGTYDYAYRFSDDDGATWLYCDYNGAGDGYNPADAGNWTVGEPVPTDTPAPNLPDWGNLQWPPSMTLTEGQTSDTAYGQVWEDGVTGAPGAAPGLAAELGYGPDGSNPAVDSGWVWAAASFNVDVGNNDEYMATFTAPAPGDYDYAYRYRFNEGPWLYCDTGGSSASDPYDPAAAGSLTVNPGGGPTDTPVPTETPSASGIDFAQIQYPASTTTTAGQPTELIFGRVYKAGVTEPAGQGPGILAQLGYGPDGSQPDGNPGWSWVEAVYNGDLGNDDEYRATLTVGVPGTHDYAYRFSANGVVWTYADNPPGTVDGYNPVDAGHLVVEAAAADFDGDGIPDSLEGNPPVAGQTNYLLPDSDGDGLGDGAEDADKNGARDEGETDARNFDSDDDGLEDGVEVLLGFDPLDPDDPTAYTDADGDGWPLPNDPDDTSVDTDGDGYADGYEAAVLGAASVGDNSLVPALGDVNQDTYVTNLDALITQAAFLDVVPATSVVGIGNGDSSRDGAVSNLDALIDQSFFIGNLATLPILP